MTFRAWLVTLAIMAAVVTPTLDAQEPAVPARPAPAGAARRRSPAVAALLGFVLPGSGHWYAGEPGRGLLVAAVYWGGVAVVTSGRTDRVGHVGGVALLGALGTSVVDGALAARRDNARLAAAASASAGRRQLRVWVTRPF